MTDKFSGNGTRVEIKKLEMWKSISTDMTKYVKQNKDRLSVWLNTTAKILAGPQVAHDQGQARN